MKPNISLQLWSLQEECQKDLLKTLEKVKAIGYEGVEFYDYFDYSAETLKAKLVELDLVVSSSHVSFQKLTETFDETLAFEQALGNQRIVVPYLQGESLADWQGYFETLKTLAPKIKAAGLQLLYHNHSHELTAFPEVDLLAQLIATVPEVRLEVDTYWLAEAGVPELPWLQKHQKQIELLHIKDLLMTETGSQSTEIGQGQLPIRSYLSFAKARKMPWIVVEQEAFQEHQPLISAEINLKAIKELLEEVYKDD